jgi:heme exporter protein A
MNAPAFPPGLLAAADLACLRGERLVFKKLSFAVPAGGALRLVGPNGSGKSSLLRVLAGLLPPAAGAIAWNGAPIEAEAHRRRLLYVGHQEAVKPWLTVAENLAFWMRLHGVAGAPGPALARLGLEALADTQGRLLSAGQKRRLALARLAALPAALWLLDEPATGLDAASLALLELLLGEHAAAGGVAVVSTHSAIELPGAVELDLGRRP